MDKGNKKLTPEEYEVIRNKGTEPPFSGKYVDTEEDGVYKCKACGTKLFSSSAKYHSGTGWPSFYEPTSGNNVRLQPDDSRGMTRVEAVCAKCGAHLGHVFDDGPQPTGKRYCINSLSMDLDKKNR